MAIEVDHVIVALEARLEDYNRRLTDAERHFNRTVSGIETSADRTEAGVSRAFRGIGTASLLVGAAVGALATAMTTGAAAAVLYASRLAEIGRQTGLTAEQVQVLERAGVRYNFTIEQGADAIEGLSRKLGEARSGSQSAMQAFRSIGISKEQLESFQSARDALPAIMNAIRSLGTESEQAAAANRVFGESGERLLPFLRQGADGYSLIADEARRAGLVTDEQARQAEEAKQRLQELALTIRTNLASALVDILPLIENAAGAFGRLGSQAASVFSWIGQTISNSPIMRYAFAAFFPAGGPGTGRANDADRYGGNGLIASAMRQGLGPTPTRLGPASISEGRKPRGRRGPSAEELARREAEAERRFRFELAQIEQDIVAARQIWATSAQQVADFEIRQIEAARDRENENFRAEAENARTNKAAARARAEQLVAANNRLAAERINNVTLQREERVREEALDAARASLDSQEQLNRLSGQLAETRVQQRQSELALLDLSLERQRIEAEGILASRTATDAEKERARRLIAGLSDLRVAASAVIYRDTESPRERYLRGLNRTAEQMSDDLDEVAISGFERLNDELSTAITGFVRLGGVAGRVLDSILSDLLRIGLQQHLIRPLATALFGGGGFGGGGGKLDPIGLVASAFAGGGSLFRFASGGGFTIGGRGGIDQNLMSINGQPVARVSRGEHVNLTPQGRSFGAMPGRVSPGQGAQQVTLRIETTSDWRAEVVSISSGLDVQMIQTATPQIVRAAATETMRSAGRPRLNR